MSVSVGFNFSVSVSVSVGFNFNSVLVPHLSAGCTVLLQTITINHVDNFKTICLTFRTSKLFSERRELTERELEDLLKPPYDMVLLDLLTPPTPKLSLSLSGSTFAFTFRAVPLKIPYMRWGERFLLVFCRVLVCWEE